MRTTILTNALGASLLALALAGCSSADSSEAAQAGEQASCDRECIIELTDSYLEALAQNDPAAAPLAEEVVLVENLERVRPGGGLWSSATGGPTAFSIHVPDPELQQAGWMGVIEREGEPVLLALRLKFDDGQITEAEHLVTEPSQGNMEHLQTVRAGLRSEVPQAQRVPHDQLIRIGASYYDALDDNDASKTPFAADCQRLENGMITAGEGVGLPPGADPDAPRAPGDCVGQIDSQLFTYIDRIENRRMIAADPVTGLAMGLSHFRHPMDNLPYKVTNADGTMGERNSENLSNEPFDMPAAHIFKIGPDRQIHEIEAVGVMAPYNSQTGWE